MGSVMAAHALQSVGTQEYVLTRTSFIADVERAYGAQAAEEIAPLVRCARP